jgi:hypothetical protein
MHVTSLKYVYASLLMPNFSKKNDVGLQNPCDHSATLIELTLHWFVVMSVDACVSTIFRHFSHHSYRLSH